MLASATLPAREPTTVGFATCADPKNPTPVEPASIREDDPRTWIVDGVRYPTWASTVLAHLADVSDRYAG